MSFFKCKMCGGTVEFEEGATVGVCDSCGTKQTLPRLDDDKKANMYDRANHFRRNNDFDKATGIYEQILNEDNTDAEAYWSLVLCRYGIEYVEDPATHKRIPTVNRAQYTSVFDDDNYKMALKYADVYQHVIYEDEAKAINEIQKGILAISKKEESFDVFICYKETDSSGRRTQDSVLANELYHQLTNEGFKVFFSRITLEDKLGTAYEPYIFAALNSARVMVVIGTKQEYFNAVWVKNEWSRYLALVKNSNGKKMLIPAYRDMDPYDLPEEFSHLQAQDMSKLGFMQDLVRGIKKIICAESPKPAVKESVVVNGSNANIAPLIKRAFMFLEDGNWNDADEYCEKVLDQDPENVDAYLGKLMAELHVKQKKKLVDCEKSFDSSGNFQKILRFGDEKLKTELLNYIKCIQERNELEYKNKIYTDAFQKMQSADGEAEFNSAGEMFHSVSGFKDADNFAKECADKAEICRKDAIYKSAKTKMTADRIKSYEEAVELFKNIPGWKDSDDQIIVCKKRIIEIDTDRNDHIYNSAKTKMQENNIDSYQIAIEVFELIPEWKDSSKQISICNEKISELEQKKENDKISNKKKRMLERKKKTTKTVFFLLLFISMYISSFFLIFFFLKSENTNFITEILIKLDFNPATDIKDIIGSYFGFTIMGFLLICCGFISAIKSYKEEFNAETDKENKDEELRKMQSKVKDCDNDDECLFILQKQGLTNVSVGKLVKFGFDESINGKKELEWRVLSVESNKALLITDRQVVKAKFNSDDSVSSWANCNIRNWLNSTFYNKTFGKKQKQMIAATQIAQGINPKYKTVQEKNSIDKVFLLSIAEATKYFASDKARVCTFIPQLGTTSEWWLRTTGDCSYSKHIAYVDNSGAIKYSGCYPGAELAVRPAIWIDIG